MIMPFLLVAFLLFNCICCSRELGATSIHKEYRNTVIGSETAIAASGFVVVNPMHDHDHKHCKPRKHHCCDTKDCPGETPDCGEHICEDYKCICQG
ncbi:hypothetical protein LINGRAHAP2_LOCUS18664 [Linum grandiflorum]